MSQSLTEFNAPLIEGVDVPDRALSENAVFIKRHQLAEHLRSEAISQDNIRRPITFKDTMRNQATGRAFRPYLFCGFAEGKRFSLGEDIRQKDVVMPAERRQRVTEGDEIARNEARALMDQLIERMLSVRPRFTPIDRPGIVVDLFASLR